MDSRFHGNDTVETNQPHQTAARRMDPLTLLYPWIKAAHLIFVIFWMAGLFMLPRFFVYHQECAVGSEEDAKWIRDRKSVV